MAEPLVTLVLLGGEPALERELADAAEELGTVAVLPPSALDRASALLVADGPDGAALDRVRAEAPARPDRPVLVAVAEDGVVAAQAMAAGARGLLGRPLTAETLRAALAAAGCFDRPAAAPPGGEGPIVVLGAVGGAGTTTLAAALAHAAQGIALDLDLATGDLATVAAATVDDADALLALASAPGLDAATLERHLAAAAGCRVLPAPSLPEHADLVDERGVARLLDAVALGSSVVVVDGGGRVGVETLPALERAAGVVVVAPADARGGVGADRVAALLHRLGVAERPVGVVASRVRRGQSPATLARTARLPLWGSVAESRAVERSSAAGEPPPAAPFAQAVAAVREAVAR